MTRTLSRTACALAFVVGGLVGCNKSETPPPGGPKGPNMDQAKGPAKSGPEVFQQRCTQCHAAGDIAARKGKGSGPDLTHVAADPAHTRDWLIAYVRDPQAANPASKMPKFTGKISAEELDMLGDFLAGLK